MAVIRFDVKYCMVSPICYIMEKAKKAFTLYLGGKKSVIRLYVGGPDIDCARPIPRRKRYIVSISFAMPFKKENKPQKKHVKPISIFRFQFSVSGETNNSEGQNNIE
jgi:hypothetical protein